ncbi:hypothetical protein PgNI_10487 [Pyricularia grisea]|uniref:Uncharacterized protein n=1 Tax=Pyricularia grisea TaxID=148305 RepID=A0A6P8AYE9_PYRGI|nr:hypothetical protein PgNI_10487 [Pyricularia grisea]TLD07383.1 hypothetical protein PgNI_10487 [Pyricularia grisea]
MLIFIHLRIMSELQMRRCRVAQDKQTHQTSFFYRRKHASDRAFITCGSSTNGMAPSGLCKSRQLICQLYFGEKESRVPVALSYLPCDVFLSRIIKRLPARFQGVADDIFHHDIVGRYIKSTVVPYLTTK